MSLTDDFVKQIELKILSGEWKIGEKIPTLRNLAEDFNVSRSVVNAGIVELQNKGYLITFPRKCTTVANWKKNGTFAVLSGIIANELYDGDFFENILDCRMSIERAAVSRAASLRTADDVDELMNILSEEELAVTVDDRIDADIKFHHAIALASHNIVYPLILNFFMDMESKFVTEFYQNNADRKFVREKHKLIIEAVKEGNAPMADENMRLLLKQGEESIKKLYLG